ncbi:MAG: ParM/StbA family protein [Anaerolineae bacterium]|nr:ParM/StbA family protein [Anaerolineae bacterium]
MMHHTNEAQNRPFYIGLDPGFGGAKAACVREGGVQVATVPSVVGVGSTDIGMLSLGKVGRRRRTQQPDEVTFDGISYLVGENVARYARPVERMDFLRLSDGPELRALFYDVIFRLLGKGHHEASIMAGLPVEVMADKALARSTLRGLRGWMVGEHAYTIDGGEIKLDITNVLVMAQPAGTYFAWGLNDHGRWGRSKPDLRAPVAICDIGFCTLDLFVVEGGEVVGRFTGGDTMGMRRAAELLIQGVRSGYGLDLSLHQADALIQQKKPWLHTPQGEMDLSAQVDQARDTTAAAVVSYVERQWGNGRQFAHLLFTGGGAEALRGMLLRQYPEGVVLSDPVTANALGLARYAARVFGK